MVAMSDLSTRVTDRLAGSAVFALLAIFLGIALTRFLLLVLPAGDPRRL
jgi:hypothetical protein